MPYERRRVDNILRKVTIREEDRIAQMVRALVHAKRQVADVLGSKPSPLKVKGQT